MEFILAPGTLTLQDIRQLMSDSQVLLKIENQACQEVERAHAVVQQVLESGRTVYGINTGFGQLAGRRIDRKDLKELQKRIIVSHACGVGSPLPRETVRLILLLKINSLAAGYSGVSLQLIEALIALYNNDICPVIPSRGSVGASGDLAPLAHMSMVLTGEGMAETGGRVVSAAEALSSAGLSPYVLREKEGLALINGTQVSTAIALCGLMKVQRNFALAVLAGSLTLDAMGGSLRPYRDFIARAKRCPGHRHVSAVVRELLKGSDIMASHRDCDKVQDPYSVRCQPQVMGALWQVITGAQQQLMDEANGVSDNPLICPETGEIVSGGNFHAEATALAADVLTIACAEAGSISERRIALLTDSRFSGLPAFLTKTPGLNSGFMLPHVTASALASENKTLAHPASVDSLPTSANQEDHVSMATFAALKLGSVADNVFTILVIETLAACQGLDLRRPLVTSPALQKYHRMIRLAVPFRDEDHYMAEDIKAASAVMEAEDYALEILQRFFPGTA